MPYFLTVGPGSAGAMTEAADPARCRWLVWIRASLRQAMLYGA